MKFTNSLYNIRLLNDLSQKDTFIHRLHPLAKLVTTVIYLTVVMSFGRYEISKLLPFVIYPLLIVILAELPVASLLHRIILVSPLIVGIGIFNPLFDNNTIVIFEISFSKGWIAFLSLLLKGVFSISAGLIFIATTRIDHFAAALRMLRIPSIFVLQLLQTYRYITVLIEEFLKMSQAYFLRAPEQGGIKPTIWGSFVGQLLLRSFDRAERVYQAMLLRGFHKEYNIGFYQKVSIKDFGYMTGWALVFAIAKTYNIPLLLETLISGVINR